MGDPGQVGKLPSLRLAVPGQEPVVVAAQGCQIEALEVGDVVEVLAQDADEVEVERLQIKLSVEKRELVKDLTTIVILP